ncbi:MAG: hypothetical protein H0A76_00190 [Candidatus Thiodubiliella endoseptemdiera]|uniref:Uncharacterized protein n=1 Tax=Candidatus Thiodubiliella endoseptemdiera TaxID=2738886 RepID=A0A853EYN7_9GAMM|nr:hypothetical protein [Candidatus Thiodubiliella endoseptemdiera]
MVGNDALGIAKTATNGHLKPSFFTTDIVWAGADDNYINITRKMQPHSQAQ